MARGPLAGTGVLVTRPRVQATELADAIEQYGGQAFCFPVIEIVAHDPQVIQDAAAEQATPDIVIFS